MATKRSNFPKVMVEDIERHPERVRRAPNGAYAWKCHYCGEYASSQTQRGLFVCRRHGGVTAAQRQPSQAGEAQRRPPGRPMTTAKRSCSKLRSVHDIVKAYQQNHTDVDATDEDMLFLRAYLEQATRERPEEEAVAQALEALVEQSKPLLESLVVNEPISSEVLLRVVAEVRLFRASQKQVSKFFLRFVKLTAEIEARHVRFIKLARIRSDISFRNAPAEHLMFFTGMLQRLLATASRVLPQEKAELLKLRLEREFEEIPERVLMVNAVASRPDGVADEGRFYRSERADDPLEEFVRLLRSQDPDLENTDQDMLYLRAYLQSLRGLTDSVKRATSALQELLERLDAFQDASMDGTTVAEALKERGDAEKLDRLEFESERFLSKLEGFTNELEVRHERIIVLARARQEVRLREEATRKVGLFGLLVERLQALLQEVVPAEQHRLMQALEEERTN